MDTKEGTAKTNWIALIILFLVVLGIGGGIYWWQKNSITQDSSDVSLPKPSTAPTSTSYPKPTTTPNETANWKIYTSEKYNFSIKYHPSWVYKEYETDKLSVAFGENNAALPRPETDQPACIGISVQPKVEDSQRTTDVSKMKKETIKIGTVTATKITLFPGRTDDMFGDSKTVTVEIPRAKNEVIAIDNFADCQVDIFNKMINTFIFFQK